MNCNQLKIILGAVSNRLFKIKGILMTEPSGLQGDILK